MRALTFALLVCLAGCASVPPSPTYNADFVAGYASALQSEHRICLLPFDSNPGAIEAHMQAYGDAHPELTMSQTLEAIFPPWKGSACAVLERPAYGKWQPQN